MPVDGEWLLELATAGLFLVPLVVGVAIFRSRMRAKATGVASMAWAAAALVLIRVYVGYLVLVLVVLAFGGGTGATRGIAGGVTKDLDTGSMTIEAEAREGSALCPGRVVQNTDGPGVIPSDCRAGRAMADARPKNAVVTGYKLDVHIDRPTKSDRRTFLAFELAGLGLALTALIALERILRRTASRHPFAIENVWWLRIIALCVGPGTWLLTALGYRFADALILRQTRLSPADPYSEIHRAGDTFASYMPLAFAVLILVLAEVWRVGIRLQDDVEATV